MSDSKICLLDIETSPLICYTWGVHEVDAVKVIKPWHLLTFAYKWLGDKKVTVLSNNPEYPTDDLMLCKAIRKVLDEADIIVAQNGNAFDIPRINTRFLIHGIAPPSPYKKIDTLKVARHVFAFSSNKLDDLGKSLDEGGKLRHRGFQMWEDCLAGNKRAWAEMKKYNAKDVELLERIYLRMRPWMRNHPHTGFKDKTCPKCGSSKLKMNGRNMQMTGLYQRFQCLSCFGYCGWKVDSKRELLRNA